MTQPNDPPSIEDIIKDPSLMPRPVLPKLPPYANPARPEARTMHDLKMVPHRLEVGTRPDALDGRIVRVLERLGMLNGLHANQIDAAVVAVRAAVLGCYICNPGDPRADDEGCSDCDIRYADFQAALHGEGPDGDTQ